MYQDDDYEDPIDDLMDRFAWAFRSRKFRGVAASAMCRALVNHYTARAGGDVTKGGRQLRRELRAAEKTLADALATFGR